MPGEGVAPPLLTTSCPRHEATMSTLSLRTRCLGGVGGAGASEEPESVGTPNSHKDLRPGKGRPSAGTLQSPLLAPTGHVSSSNVNTSNAGHTPRALQCLLG